MRIMSRADESSRREIEMMAANDKRILSERTSHSVGSLGLKLLELLTYTANDEI